MWRKFENGVVSWEAKTIHSYDYKKELSCSRFKFDFAHPSQRFHEKSHGESFLELAQTQFRPNGLYFLDEPEAALSPQRQLTLLLEIERCAREESQFFIVTHSPILLGIPGRRY